MIKRGSNNANELVGVDPNRRFARKLGSFSRDENDLPDEETEKTQSGDDELENEVDNEAGDNEPKEEEANNVSQINSAGDEEESNNTSTTASLLGDSLKTKLLLFIKANPWVIGILIVIFIIFVVLLSFSNADTSNGSFDETCDFNLAKVSLKTCDSDEEAKEMTIKEYVFGVVYAINQNNELSDEALKALMIAVKTNALAMGNYENENKSLSLDTCDVSFASEVPSDASSKYDTLYAEISNYLYLANSYNDAITSLSESDKLDISPGTQEKFAQNESDDYRAILDDIYNNGIDSVDTVVVGDSRVRGMVNAGVITDAKAVYGEGYGYNWLVGNGSFDASKTNYPQGGISGIKTLAETTENIVLWLGVNDFSYVSADTYFKEYYKLATEEYPSKKFYIVSVGPVDDDKATVKNEDIDVFNENLKILVNNSDADNLKFLNIDYSIKEYDNAGLHYGDDDYKKIYKSITRSIGGTKFGAYKIYDLASYCEFIPAENSNSASEVCEEMSLTSTSLTRQEFIDKVRSFYSKKKTSYASAFANNAGEIYDIAVRNNINPELVVARPQVEGYSPGNKDNSNNYWGLGCTNTGGRKACIKYSSFSDGVAGFVKNVSKYSTLSDMASKYAYIGSYWFNPGSSSAGGCHYFEYVKKYLSSERANVVAKYCAKGKRCTGSNCLATTDEDQNAYKMYQIQRMVEERNNIFGIISTQVCTNSASGCLYKQSNPLWASIPLGSSATTMGRSGCAVTALAMGIACNNVQTTISNFNAGEFVKALNNGKCFDGSGGIYWKCSTIAKIAPSVSYVGRHEGLKSYSQARIIELLNSYDKSKYFILIKIRNSHTNSHFLLFQETTDNGVSVKDPATGAMNTIKYKDIEKIEVYRYKG